MSDVTESVDVNVPVSTAYNQWTQFESFPQFMEGVESVTQTDKVHTRWVTSVGGARREFDAEITEQHPDERVAWKSVGGDTKHAGVVLTHKQLLDQVWGPGHAHQMQYLRVYMTQLRHKLERNPARPKVLVTEPGIGYRLKQQA